MTTIELTAITAAKSTFPTTSCLNPAFNYVPAAATDIAKTFARIRAQQEPATNITQIKREKAAKAKISAAA